MAVTISLFFFLTFCSLPENTNTRIVVVVVVVVAKKGNGFLDKAHAMKNIIFIILYTYKHAQAHIKERLFFEMVNE